MGWKFTVGKSYDLARRNLLHSKMKTSNGLTLFRTRLQKSIPYIRQDNTCINRTLVATIIARTWFVCYSEVCTELLVQIKKNLFGPWICRESHALFQTIQAQYVLCCRPNRPGNPYSQLRGVPPAHRADSYLVLI